MSGTIAHKTDSLHVHVFGLRPVCAVNFSRDQSSAKLINFLDSRLQTPDLILEIIEDRVLSLEDRGSRDRQLTFERYCMSVNQHFNGKRLKLSDSLQELRERVLRGKYRIPFYMSTGESVDRNLF